MYINISEFAKINGVSVRTLHYYDEIGLLKPDYVNPENGYRYYGRESFLKMQEILLYKELSFPLKTIVKMISSPDYDKNEAIKDQKHLLTLKKQQLEKVIIALEMLEKGEIVMDFSTFSVNEVEEFKEEAKKRWGKTKEYKEYTEKTAGYTKIGWNDMENGLNKIITGFTELKKAGNSESSDLSIAQVKKLQSFITKTQYTCSNEILFSLGKMYIEDERFKNNIDRFGEGTAEFMSRAIEYYCSKN